jgi:AAA ATPase domain
VTPPRHWERVTPVIGRGQGARGEGDLVVQLTNAIRWSDTPLTLLFAGHRGGGKSTELFRLQEALANPPQGQEKFFVVYFEADKEDIDVNDIDFPDLLLAIVRQLGKALRERAQEELHPPWLRRFVDDLKRFLGSEVEFEKLELDAKIAKFTAAIKSSPDARVEIRKALEPEVSNLINAANTLLDDAVKRLKAKGYRNLVLIVDNLDRIVLRDIPNSQFNTHEQLFINRGAQLAQLRCHVVYTLPISLVFSPKATALVNVFVRRPDVLPMVKVIEPKDRKDSPAGMEAMREVVGKRLKAAEVAPERAFDSPDTLDYLCRMSGGHIRNLLILIRSACTVAGVLPLTRGIAKQAVRGMSNDFERALNSPRFFRSPASDRPNA